MSARSTLVCFDAFGTLFKPKRPIHQQYGEVARSLGLSEFSDEDLASSFTRAFKDENVRNPNYGKATGLGAEKWWTNIINNTFSSVTVEDLPKGLAPRLIHRFHCGDGYVLFPDVKPLLRTLHAHARHNNDNLMVGVITNSDDRVPDILRSLGLKVDNIRYGDPVSHPSNSMHDFDFAIMSYDVGAEKPDRRIFDAAVETLDSIITASQSSSSMPRASDWQKVYIGDEYKKDVVGALAAGWDAALIDRDGSQNGDAVHTLPADDPTTLFTALEKSTALSFKNLQEVSSRLPT